MRPECSEIDLTTVLIALFAFRDNLLRQREWGCR